jgi:ABC-type dipeptide/oligopeptide/nickel transport system permease subunit
VRYGAVLGAGLLIAVVSTALTIALSGLGLAFSFLSFGWIIDVICRAASSLVTEPFVAAATTLVYLDLRIRAEGLDLELDIAEHFHRVG